MNVGPYRDGESPGMLSHRLSRRAALRRVTGAGAAIALSANTLSRPSVVTAQEGTPMTDATPTAGGAPTVVLVHGAFADASGWAGVISRLQAEGIAAMAPANPLRSVSGDAAYIASVVNQIPGPVLLVGHSYGGMVISNAAPLAENVVGLVYVCAFLPEEGESIQALAEQSTDSLLGRRAAPGPLPDGRRAGGGHRALHRPGGVP